MVERDFHSDSSGILVIPWLWLNSASRQALLGSLGQIHSKRQNRLKFLEIRQPAVYLCLGSRKSKERTRIF
jgi:hypothetical protein